MARRGMAAGSSGKGYLLILAAVLYVLYSVAVAFNTLHDCGKVGADKHWSFLPPQWECESSFRP